MTFWRAFVRRLNSSCWFGHADRLYDRDRRGRMVLICAGCGDTKLVLPELSRRPLASPKATRLVKDNVRPWRKVSQR